jgi:hypothetical protein
MIYEKHVSLKKCRTSLPIASHHIDIVYRVISPDFLPLSHFSPLGFSYFVDFSVVMYWDSDDIATAKMLNEEYAAVPLDEKEYFGTPRFARRQYDFSVNNILKAVLLVFFMAIGSFTLGFDVGQNWKAGSEWEAGEDGLLPPQALVPDSVCFL